MHINMHVESLKVQCSAFAANNLFRAGERKLSMAIVA